MSKLKSGTKYAVLGTGYSTKIAIPVKLLSQFLEEGFEVEFSWDSKDDRDRVKDVKNIESCKFFDGIEIDHAIAEAKLSGTI